MKFIANTILLALLLAVGVNAGPFATPQVDACSTEGTLCSDIGFLPCCAGLTCTVDVGEVGVS